MRKPVLPFGQTGFLGAGGKSLHEVLKGLAGDEFNRLGGFNLYLLSRLGIDPSAGLAGCNLECAEPDKLDGLGLFDARLDSINNGIHGALGVSFAASEGFLDGGNEFDFVHLGQRVGERVEAR